MIKDADGSGVTVKKNSGDTGASSVTLNFYGPAHGSSNWNSAQTVYVDVIDDSIDKGTSWSMVQAIYFKVTSQDPALNGKESAISNITIISTDNDAAVRFYCTLRRNGMGFAL